MAAEATLETKGLSRATVCLKQGHSALGLWTATLTSCREPPPTLVNHR